MHVSRRVLLLLFFGASACGGAASSPASPATPAGERVLVNTDEGGLALGGHDPVAYVTDRAPVVGSEQHTSRHGGAVYRFASAEHKATFDADPARYAPRYGGYCAYAASQNRLSPSDPTVWGVVDDSLVLFTNPDFKAHFDEDPAGHKQAADRNWPGLVAKHGKPAAP